MGLIRVGMAAALAMAVMMTAGCGQTQKIGGTDGSSVPADDAKVLLSTLSTVQGKVGGSTGTVSVQSTHSLGTLSLPTQSLKKIQSAESSGIDSEGFRTSFFEVQTDKGPFTITQKTRYRDATRTILLDTDYIALLQKTHYIEGTYREVSSAYIYTDSATAEVTYGVDAKIYLVTSVAATTEGSAQFTVLSTGITMDITHILAHVFADQKQADADIAFDWSAPIHGNRYTGDVKVTIRLSDFADTTQVSGTIRRDGAKVGIVRLNPQSHILEFVLDSGTTISLN